MSPSYHWGCCCDIDMSGVYIMSVWDSAVYRIHPTWDGHTRIALPCPAEYESVFTYGYSWHGKRLAVGGIWERSGSLDDRSEVVWFYPRNWDSYDATFEPLSLYIYNDGWGIPIWAALDETGFVGYAVRTEEYGNDSAMRVHTLDGDYRDTLVGGHPAYPTGILTRMITHTPAAPLCQGDSIYLLTDCYTYAPWPDPSGVNTIMLVGNGTTNSWTIENVSMALDTGDWKSANYYHYQDHTCVTANGVIYYVRTLYRNALGYYGVRTMVRSGGEWSYSDFWHPDWTTCNVLGIAAMRSIDQDGPPEYADMPILQFNNKLYYPSPAGGWSEHPDWNGHGFMYGVSAPMGLAFDGNQRPIMYGRCSVTGTYSVGRYNDGSWEYYTPTTPSGGVPYGSITAR